MTPDPNTDERLAKLFRDTPGDERHPSPFADDIPAGSTPRARLANAIVRLRHIRGRAGSDGLTPSATRSLLDEVVRALEAIATVLPEEDDTSS